MIDIILPDEQSAAEWSGGITRELYIMPKGSSYQKRNFELRISSAVVSDEETVFTELPDYQRILMLLEGRLKLQHDNAPLRELSLHEADEFAGSAATKSWGKCEDFNIMVRKNAPFTAGLEYCQQSDKMLVPNELPQFVYVLKGRLQLVSSAGTIEAGEKALLVIKEPNEILELRAERDRPEYIYVRLENKP